jgi:hypothetical protein
MCATRQKIQCLECETDLLERFIPVFVRRTHLLPHTVSLLANPAHYSVPFTKNSFSKKCEMTISFNFFCAHLNYFFSPGPLFCDLNASEQLFDALMTWDLLGELQSTDLSLKFFRQFDRNLKIGAPRRTRLDVRFDELGRDLFLAEHMPEDYVLTMAIDRPTGLSVGPRGTIHCGDSRL